MTTIETPRLRYYLTVSFVLLSLFFLLGSLSLLVYLVNRFVLSSCFSSSVGVCPICLAFRCSSLLGVIVVVVVGLLSSRCFIVR